MSFVNNETKELHCKIVYYGPSLGGKTTNVQWIYQNTAEEQKSPLNIETERTLFFDFLPLFIGNIHGYQTRFHVYSVPGQVVYDASRKLIMTGLDGVIFVADSQPERMEENIEALRNLELNLQQQGYDIRQIPIVMQYNKRDLDNVTPIEEMRLSLNKYNFPEVQAVASDGKGVIESLKIISKSIISVLKGGEI